MKIRFFTVVFTIILLFFAFNQIYFIFKNLSATKIEAHFGALRPFGGQADVYFRAYKVGRTLKIRPADDYSKSVVDVALYPKDLILPKNIQVQLRKKTVFFKFQHDYFEIIYPKVPQKELLSSGDFVEGLNTIDVKDYLASQDSDSLDEIKDNLQSATKSLDKALLSLSDLFESLDNTVKNSQKNIQNTTENIGIISKNLAQMSDRLNQVTTLKRMDNSAGNIDITTDYVKESAKNIEEITKNLSVLTCNLAQQSSEIDSIIKNTNSVLSSTSTITKGLNNTLSKNFGVFRLLFGRAVSK